MPACRRCGTGIAPDAVWPGDLCQSCYERAELRRDMILLAVGIVLIATALWVGWELVFAPTGLLGHIRAEWPDFAVRMAGTAVLVAVSAILLLGGVMARTRSLRATLSGLGITMLVATALFLIWSVARALLG